MSARRSFKSTLTANFTANIVRNVWSYSIIFCGHFPDQTYTFCEEEVADETRGGFYVRQLLGAANIDGGPLFHLLAGNLSFQVEHHLYPDMPSSRYAEIAPRVRDICRRYGLPYNTGPLHKQLGTVHRTILRLAFPGGKMRPKPGPTCRRESGLALGRSRQGRQQRARAAVVAMLAQVIPARSQARGARRRSDRQRGPSSEVLMWAGMSSAPSSVCVQ